MGSNAQPAYAIVEVPGSWQQHGDACYQLRTARGKLVCYVRWPKGGFPNCQRCESCRCQHVAAVRAWRKERRKAG